jgi:DNA-binding NtrC family response regulator
MTISASLRESAATRPRQRATILVADDEKLIRWSLRERLAGAGYDVVEAATGAETRAAFANGVDLVLLDYRLPDVEGFELLHEMREAEPDVPIVMLTAHASVEHAVQAMKSGAFHYAGKPFGLDAVLLIVERALENTRLRREVRALRARQAESPSIDKIIGRSPKLRRVKELIARIAASPASTVLVTGESGTGKDLAAQAIHAASDRADRAFLNITCSALPASLLESELFGHERGAFTDAKNRKLGLFEHADGGTVFLDEIGEMEPPLQAKLLRFLEDKSLRRVGGAIDIHADVRIVAATNVDLRDAVRRGAFREDLYYRLAVLTVHLPPLRERGSDAELLAMFFVERFNQEFGKRVAQIHPDALRMIRSYPWPGNVRELRNAVERAVLLADAEELGVDDFSMLAAPAEKAPAFRLPANGIDLRDLEHDLIMQALERTAGNKTRAGALLGLNRDQVRYRVERYLAAVSRQKRQE